MTSQIILKSIEDMKTFADMVTDICGSVNVRSIDRSQIYDAKSILSIMLMGTSKPFEIELISNEHSDIERFKTLVEKFNH